MAEVYQVSEFGPMSGSTGKRKKYKKLVLGAAVRAKLASTMLAPLLALGATGLITLAVVEESTMNVLQDPPPAYSWDDGGGQQQGNRPPAEKPKPPEKKPQASPSATPKTSPSPSPSTSPSPSPSPSTSPSPSPSTSPSPSPSPSPSTSPSPSPSAPVYYYDDSGDDDSGEGEQDPSITYGGHFQASGYKYSDITISGSVSLGSADYAKISPKGVVMHVYDIELGGYEGDAPVEIVSGGGPWAIASDGSYSYTFTGTTTNNPDWYPDFDPQNSLSVTMSTEFYKTGTDTPLATDSQTVTIYPG